MYTSFWLNSSNINLFSPQNCLAGCSEVVASYKTALHRVRQCTSSQGSPHPWPEPVTVSPPSYSDKQRWPPKFPPRTTTGGASGCSKL